MRRSRGQTVMSCSIAVSPPDLDGHGPRVSGLRQASDRLHLSILHFAEILWCEGAF